MKKEDLDKINRELLDESQKNEKEIYRNFAKKNLVFANEFKYTIYVALFWSVFAYIGQLILITNGVMMPLMETFPFILACNSLGIGVVAKKIVDLIFKTKEKLRKFSNAKTQAEKIQEEIKYPIELEKLENRNKTIEQIMNSLNSNQNILNSVSSEYNINDKNMSQTEEDTKKKIEFYSKLLKDKYAELDVLSTQKILSEESWTMRSGLIAKILKVLVAGMTGAGFMCFSQLPVLILKDLHCSMYNLFLVPCIIGFTASGGYMIKRNRDYMKAFNNLNNELGKEALPDKMSKEEQYDISSKIENKIMEIRDASLQLQEQKIIMESFSKDNDKKLQTVESEKVNKITLERNENDATLAVQPSFRENENEQVIESKETPFTLKRKLSNKYNSQKY